MLRLLGFLSGSVIVGAALFVLAESPEVVKKAAEGDLAQADIRQAIAQSKDKLQQQIQEAIKPAATSGTDSGAKSTAVEIPPTNANPETLAKVKNTELALAATIDEIAASNERLNNALAAVTDQQNQATAQSVFPTATLAPSRKSAKPMANPMPQPMTSPSDEENTPTLAMLDKTKALPPLDTDPLNRQPQQLSLPDSSQDRSQVPDDGSAVDDNQAWHTVWDGFRSELSAKGFSRQLSKQTGRDLRIKRQGPGRYLVQMSYRSMEDLEAGLSEIGAKTGLKLTAKTL
ncbi:MAG: hypothetical protein V7677_11745 [Motiliproteus sp.]